MVTIYRIFNTVLECDFPLPELPLISGRSISVSVKLADPDLFDSSGFEKTFEWFSASGESICWCERRVDEYLYVFPGHASYHISNIGVISCFMQAGSNMQMLRQLLLNQIIPRYLATRGQLVLHASAVALENGRSIAFLGNSGFGKSTLASSFHRNGAQLISDDSILLRPGDDGVEVIGGFPGIRLFPDSMHAVFNEVSGFSRYTPYTDKQQLILKGEVGGQMQPRVLDAIFLLNDPGQIDKDAIDKDVSLSIEPVSGSTAMMAMIYCAFSLDPADQLSIPVQGCHRFRWKVATHSV